MVDPWILLLAWLAINSDESLPDSMVSRPTFGMAVRAVAIQEGLLIDRDRSATIWEVRQIRTLVKDAPAFELVHLLPDLEMLQQSLEFGIKRKEWLEKYGNLYPKVAAEWAWQEQLADLDARIEVYRTAINVRESLTCKLESTDSLCPVQLYPRRIAYEVRYGLQRLADMLGKDAMYAGSLPLPVDTTGFRRLR